jgi:tetratricopeptide (TPR) repeat protein
MVLLSVAAGTFALWACGPYFPNWVLGQDDSFLEPPGGLLRHEVNRVKITADPFQAQPGDDPFQQTADADAADLAKALAKSGVPADRRTALTARHAELRKSLQEHSLAACAACQDEESRGKAAPPLPAGVTVPDGLPVEMADYLQGAVAYHQGRFPDAVAAWQRLLNRPAADRRLRSTWAAFMLGKAALRSDPKDSLHWFETTRELASHGFEDSLGLAAASLGWQARAELDLGHFDRALILYTRQAKTGDPLALSSLQATCRQAFKKGPDALNAVARSPQARDAMTAFLVSDHHGSWNDVWIDEENAAEDGVATEPETKADPAIAAWLKAVKAAGVKDAAGADRLAWAAYQGGDFASARDWLQRAPDDAPMARWIRARLLLHDGKLAEAQTLMDEVARTAPDLGMDEGEVDYYSPWGGGGKLNTPSLAHAETGALLLTQGRYPQALDHFLRSGFWLEAGYVADRVMTVDELKSYVDATWPASLAVGRPTVEEGDYLFSGSKMPEPGQVAHDVRYLLGRRLVRNGRLAEAKAYLPNDLHPLLEALAKAEQEGNDKARPADQRARALFQAACITRRQGMEIAGSENDPDWTYLQGNYELAAFPDSVERRAKNKVLVPAKDEAERAAKSAVEPWKRFHYRYRAADLAHEAASLLPDGSEDKARMLATGGGWLKLREPEIAAGFYRDLMSCCGSTRLGKEAERLRRLPDVPECEMGVPAARKPDEP